ncbi:hypothetical protein [Ectobacillus panaciterrae]|uniref:hypothetical protein n=1 Tax=Ectobacillus panaciterrae TaxID=363872 RepID=UPI0003F89075|nr:hypothetical protein [Ectobacillus panaciterrae]
MEIKEIKGYELVKAQANTSEDFFNRSEVTYMHEGTERTLHVLYIRYFEEQLQQFTPFSGNPVFIVGERGIEFKEIAALACLLQDPQLINRKRMYINTLEEFRTYFDAANMNRLQQIVMQLYKGLKPGVAN